ncbi:AAA family ATPase [Candidatus Woesearchaeota archaeon]|nr:AAA family ATPase [Candidatus Woesearchaeota archaeon]
MGQDRDSSRDSRGVDLRSKLDEMQQLIVVLQEELDALKAPPYLCGTVLEITNTAAMISVDQQGVYEIPSNKELKEKVKKGNKVILNPLSKAIIGYSQFNTQLGPVVIVEEVINDRLKVQICGEPRTILSSLADIRAGDEVVLDSSKLMAVEKLSRKKSKFFLEEVPETPWDSIGGLEETIETIKEEIVNPFVHKEIFAKYGRKPAKGILLYGPPGCGKTLLAKSIAYNLSAISKNGKDDVKGYFIKVNGPEILDKWLGNSEANIRKIYESAREAARESESPVVVFVDEAEAVLKTRGSGISTDVYDSIVPQFLSEMDGMTENNNIITILATNREDIIDPAVLRDGRVDKKIKVSRPNKEGTKEIFEIYLKDKPLREKKCKTKELAEKLAEEIHDEENVLYNILIPQGQANQQFLYKHVVSGAMIKGIVDRAVTYAIKREIAGEKAGISSDDLSKALQESFVDASQITQSLVKDDWETVFGARGKQFHEAYKQGIIILENALK